MALLLGAIERSMDNAAQYRQLQGVLAPDNPSDHSLPADIGWLASHESRLRCTFRLGPQGSLMPAHVVLMPSTLKVRALQGVPKHM
jgi:hypothetical protein